MAELTTTSYLILGLLTSRDWSAYEIAEQMGKGVTAIWPRADRQMYNVPKRLVEEGLAVATKEMTGRRARTVYSITPAGRDALRTWLATDAQAPSLEFEGMVRVLFADEGTIEDLRANLRLMAEQAHASRSLFVDHAAYMAANDGGTFPDRQHVFALANVFMVGHYTHIIEWADEALAAIESWPDPRSPATSHKADTQALLARSLRLGADDDT